VRRVPRLRRSSHRTDTPALPGWADVWRPALRAFEIGLHPRSAPDLYLEQHDTLGEVGLAGRLVPNEPHYADHHKEHAQGCGSDCPHSVLPITVASHIGTSPPIIEDRPIQPIPYRVLARFSSSALLRNSIEFHINRERNLSSRLCAVCDAPA
jgi:hypothetical protein